MIKDDAINKLIALQADDDKELAHKAADYILCELLKSLGYSDVVYEYEKIGKWFS